jgi:hypothetical protein
MTTPNKNFIDNSGKLMRTLCAILFAILLRDYYTGNLAAYWIIFMTIILTGFFFVKGIAALELRRGKRFRMVNGPEGYPSSL